jgi:hypothetical protein
MITSIRIVNVLGDQVELNTNVIPMRRMLTHPEVRDEEVERAREDGIWDTPQYLGKRLWTLEGDIFGATSAEFMQRRQSLVRAIMPHPDLGYRYVGTIYAIFEGITEELSATFKHDGPWDIPFEALAPARSTFLLNLKSADPKLFGPLQTSDVSAPAPPVGVSFPITFPVVFDPEGSPQEVLVTNSGEREVYPVVIMYGPASNPTIYKRNSDGSQDSIQVGLSLLDNSQYVVLDFKQRTAVLWNGDSVYDWVTATRWFKLYPGNNTFTYGGGATFSPAKATVQWSNAYIL